MSLLKSLLMDKEIFKALEEVDKFIEDNDVEDGSLAQSLEFDKDIFSSEDLVNDFLGAHFLGGHTIEDEKKKFIVTLLGAEGFVDSTIKKVPLREGIIIVVGILRPMTEDNPFFFKDGDNNIKLNSDVPHIIELAKVVSGFHPRFGDIEITKETLVSFKNNFDANVIGVDISIDFDHEVREAAGWLKEVFLSVDEESLLGVVRWTPKGALSLSDKEFRYFSPEYSLDFVHQHTGESHGPTLSGGALTNRPFLKMDAMVELNNKNSKGPIEVDKILLVDHEKKVGVLDKLISDLKLSEAQTVNIVTNLKAENVKLSDENKTLKEAAEKAEKSDMHNKLFTEGKINKAQLTLLDEGKNIYEVLQMNTKLNVSPNGKVITDEIVQLSDDEKKMAKTLDLTDEEFVKYNQ